MTLLSIKLNYIEFHCYPTVDWIGVAVKDVCVHVIFTRTCICIKYKLHRWESSKDYKKYYFVYPSFHIVPLYSLCMKK